MRNILIAFLLAITQPAFCASLKQLSVSEITLDSNAQAGKNLIHCAPFYDFRHDSLWWRFRHRWI
jgi:hypothetical protein